VIEYWHIIAILAGAVCNVILLFTYIKWFRKARLSKPQETVKLLSTFYKALAVTCFLPIVSPAYWISVNPLFWDIVRPFLPGLYHGAGLGMLFVFFVCFSVVFCLLCVVAASWLSSGRGRELGILLSIVFTLTSLFSLGSLYHDLIWAIGDPSYRWTAYLLYILANVSIAITNTLSIYCLVATEHVDVG
jgi:hypothetical protein